ncbi:serine/arginine repetitive matrix protein 1 [Actinomyces sp. SKVG-SVH-4(1)]|uniref:variant leucine-rich repeat-containing protein n=1 Tax=Actinomyces sp. SKVG-SVH-4(1) TaxID=3240382 RepID=UPI003AF2B618
MPAHTPDDERRAADPSTEPEVLEYLAKAFPDLRPVVAANPAIPAVLREQVLQMGANDLPNVSPASPTNATDASDTNRPRTAETACLPTASTADYSSVSTYSVIPVETAPQTMVLGASSAAPATASAPGTAAPPASGTAPAVSTAPPLNRPAPRSSSHAGLMTTLVVVLILVVAAAGVLGGMLLANRGRQSDTTSASAATAAPSSSAGTAAEQAAPPTAGPILPSGPALPTSTTTYSYQYVDTPSKNISCVLSNEGVGCSILERSYASSGMQDCPDREFSIVALAGRTEVRCGEEYLGQPGDTFHTLEYGETTTFSDYACTSQSKGMTCWNTITGRGFTISRKSLIRF